MNREDIIRMAREAGLWIALEGEAKTADENQLIHFATLVAADEREKEREACAKLCDYLWEYKVAEAHECATSIRKRGDYE